MIFLAIMPLSAMFFNFMIPLMIGARDVAFPRLNAFSYWVFLAGGLLLNASFLLGGAPDAGWFGYANLTSRQFSPGHNIDFWALGLQVLGVSSLAAAFNFIGIMGWGVWAHHMFSTGLGPIADSVFSLTTMLIAIPTGVKIFNWLGTLWGGSLHFTTSLKFALSFIAMFTIGGLSGIMHASPP